MSQEWIEWCLVQREDTGGEEGARRDERVLKYLRRAEGRAEFHSPDIVRGQARAWEREGSAILIPIGKPKSLLL